MVSPTKNVHYTDVDIPDLILQTDFGHRPKKIDAPHFATQGIRNSNLKLNL